MAKSDVTIKITPELDFGKVNVKKLHPDAIIPTKGSELASGFDLHALDVVPAHMWQNSNNDNFTVYALTPMERVFIRTGIAVQMSAGMEAQIRPRSGLGLKSGIHVHLGTIDADYTGELGIVVTNLGYLPFIVKKGNRIAQLVFAPVLHGVQLAEAEKVKKTKRGADGFGSTGTK